MLDHVGNASGDISGGRMDEADLPPYQEDHGTVGVPDQIVQDERHRFIPIRADKSAFVKDEAWQNGFTWAQIVEGFQNQEWPGWTLHDLGVRLDRSGLVVIDADVVPVKEGETPRPGCAVLHEGPLQFELTEPGRAQVRTVVPFHDGRAELRELVADGLELPRTLVMKSAGRPDGSHLPGLHIYYRQNPEWVVRPGVLSPHVEVKASGIARVTTDFEILEDAPIATLPRELAQAVRPAEGRARHGGGRGGGGHAPGTFGAYAQAGVNNALTAIKGQIVNSTWWTEDQADQAVRLLNSLLADPISESRLESTVLRAKGWDA